jgi:hypothetical protein
MLCLLVSPGAKAQVGALQTDCNLGGKQGGSYQFVATCAGQSISPDGQFAVVQRAYTDDQPPIEFQTPQGLTLGKMPSLSDDMPFSVSWAPNSKWFYVNHHVGSFMDVLQVFEVVGHTAVERPALVKAAVKIATNRYPCLPPKMVLPNGARWTSDGRQIVLVTISRPNACSPDFSKHPGEWHSLWMIGDARSGAIDPASIRVQPNDKPFQAPSDGAYAQH